MKVKVIFILIIVISFLFFQKVYSQFRHPWELVMNTENGPATITFRINSTSPCIWEPH